MVSPFVHILVYIHTNSICSSFVCLSSEISNGRLHIYCVCARASVSMLEKKRKKFEYKAKDWKYDRKDCARIDYMWKWMQCCVYWSLEELSVLLLLSPLLLHCTHSSKHNIIAERFHHHHETARGRSSSALTLLVDKSGVHTFVCMGDVFVFVCVYVCASLRKFTARMLPQYSIAWCYCCFSLYAQRLA